LEGVAALHGADGRPLRLDELYLDTTFASKHYLHFPKRSAALNRVWELAQEWIRRNGMYRNRRDKHVVLLDLPAQYGSEAILKALYEKSQLKWRVHVSDSKYREYLCSDELGDCADADQRQAEWIHACSWKGRRGEDYGWKDRKRIPCSSGQYEVRRIRPSAMFFTGQVLESMRGGVAKPFDEDGQSYRLCYSCHASLTELREFVAYFGNPRKIVPCAKPLRLNAANWSQTVVDLVRTSANGNCSSTSQDILGSLIHLSSPEATAAARSAGDRNDFWSSPQLGSDCKRRKRPPAASMDVEGAKRSVLVSVASAVTTSDEDGDSSSSATSRAVAQRRRFGKSRSNCSRLSMPAQVLPSSLRQESEELLASAAAGSRNRRASLPYNFKIPEIIITPSSPSPDPNHPDYPEFFDCKLYLESKSSASTSSSNDEPRDYNSWDCGVGHSLVAAAQFSSCSLNLRLSDEVVGVTSSCSMDVSSEMDAEEARASTPDFQAVLATAETDRERRNCAKFAAAQGLPSGPHQLHM